MIPRSSLSKAKSPSFTTSSPVTIRNIRLPIKYSYLGTSAQESSAREKSVQDSAQSAENYGNCYITLFILFILIISLHFDDYFLDFKAENKKLKAQNDEFRRQIDELNEKFQTISSSYKTLQESNEILMEVNQEFGRENDQLQSELKKYRSFELPIRSSDDDTRSNKRKSSKSKRSQKSKRKGKSRRRITRSKGKRYKSGSEGKSKGK